MWSHPFMFQYPTNPAETPTPHVASPSLLSYRVRNRPNQPALVPSGPLASVTVPLTRAGSAARVRCRRWAPVAGSQKRSVPAPLSVTTAWPSGVTATGAVRICPPLSGSVRVCPRPSSLASQARRRIHVFARTPRNSVAFPNRHYDVHTPHMMMSISKSLPRNFGEDPERVAQQEDGTGLQIPTADRIGSGVSMDAEGLMGIARS